MPELTYTVTRDGAGRATVTVRGELDHLTFAPLLAELDRLVGEGRTCLLLDLDGVTFCDSSGLNLLLRAHRRASNAGGWLRIARPSDDLRRTLSITNLDQLLPLYLSVEDANHDASGG